MAFQLLNKKLPVNGWQKKGTATQQAAFQKEQKRFAQSNSELDKKEAELRQLTQSRQENPSLHGQSKKILNAIVVDVRFYNNFCLIDYCFCNAEVTLL